MGTNSPERGHNDYFPIVQKHLEHGQYELFACGADAPSIEDVESFASEVGVRLPADFVSFSVSRIGGLYVAVKEELWPRPKKWDVGPFWSMLYGMYVYGFGNRIPEFMDIRIQTREFRQRSETDYVPCLAVVGDADVYVFDREGALLQWDHETGECRPVGKSFIEAFEYELAELADRKKRKLAGEDKPA